jgi:hypothetical protein
MDDKTKVWDAIFSIGRTFGYSKEVCRKKIERRLSHFTPSARSTVGALEEAKKLFEAHDRPLWMESIEDMAKWRRAALKRCHERSKEAEARLEAFNHRLAKMEKAQQKDAEWIQVIDKHISQRIGSSSKELPKPIIQALFPKVIFIPFKDHLTGSPTIERKKS